MRSILYSAVVLAAVAAASPLDARDSSFSEIERGQRLVTAGDCVACHTKLTEGTPFAGGRPIETPFGIIYSPNLTPDPETGIGAWSADDFYRAMHSGIGPDGTHLYPAFPYPHFTKLSREDVDAIFAYLNTLEPVRNTRPEPELLWPLNHRFLMAVWNWLFFDEGSFQPDPSKSDEWNRGAYLVQGAGHCGACHTPKNLAGAADGDEALHGGELQDWYAPKIAANRNGGTGSWEVSDVVEYLKTGRNRYSGATGLMAEVVENSTSRLPEADLRAIAVYIKDLDSAPPPLSGPPDSRVLSAGKAIFEDTCAACHKADGKGIPRMFPPLAGNAIVQSSNPATLLRVILEGARTATTDRQPTPSTMPAFDWKLTDEEIAAVASYVRNSWGNSAAAVSVGEVSAQREALVAETH